MDCINALFIYSNVSISNQYIIFLFLVLSIHTKFYINYFIINKCIYFWCISYINYCYYCFYVYIKIITIICFYNNYDLSAVFFIKLGDLSMGNQCNNKWWSSNYMVVWINIFCMYTSITISLTKIIEFFKIFY